MKKMIKGSNSLGFMKQLASELAETAESLLSNEGYSVTSQCNGDSVSDIVLTVFCNSSTDGMMPEIDLTVKLNEAGVYVFNCKLTFPTLSYPDGTDYDDSISYWLDKWARVGEAITQVNQYGW